MIHKKRRSLVPFERQISLLTLAPVAILGILMITVVGIGYLTILQKLVLDRNTSIVSLSAASMTQELSNFELLLTTTAQALDERSTDLPAQRQLLVDWQGVFRSFDGGVTLLDSDGLAIASTPNAIERLGRNYSFRSYFKTVQASQKPSISTVLNEVPTGQLAVVIAVPVHPQGPNTNVIIGVLYLQKHIWPKEMEVLQSGRGETAYLVDNQGSILYHPDPTRIGESILPEPELALLLTKNVPQSIVYTSNLNHERKTASWCPIPDANWAIVMEEPWNSLIAPAVPYFFGLTGILMAALVFSLILLLMEMRRVFTPLFGLVQEARRVSEGSHFQPLAEEGPAEIILLTNTFNRMVTALNEQQKALRQYAQKVLQSQEEERRRISRDLHDETVQDLVGLTQRIDLTRAMLTRDPAAARRRLDELQTLTMRALTDVRRMSNALRPHMLEDLGLVSAVRALCDELSADMVTTSTSVEILGHERRMSADQELIAFRILQEALFNVRKHARSASEVKVTLDYQEDSFHAVVNDNGSGFPIENLDNLLSEGHLGLAGMHERASLFGGRVEIQSQSEQGTQVKLWLPASEDELGSPELPVASISQPR